MTKDEVLKQVNRILGKIRCPNCGWKGTREECGQEEISEGYIDLCPKCESDMEGDTNE